MAFQSDAFQNDAFQIVAGPTSGTMAAVVSPSFSATFIGTVRIAGVLAATLSPGFAANVAGVVAVRGTMAAGLHIGLVADFAGTSEGNIVIIPRDTVGGTAYLLELAGADNETGDAIDVYFSTDGFNSLPSDPKPNVEYNGRIKVPGNYERTLFSSGTTSGQISVGAGLIELVNMDGELDYLRSIAFDGYELRILAIPRRTPKYEDAVLVFSGTAEQVELSWERAAVRIRDRLAELDKPLQTVKYAGTTISGGMSEAEGKPDDLKDSLKPTAWGQPKQVAAINSNQFDLIFDLGQNGLQSVGEVRDKGVLLTATGIDYATTALLIAANVPSGQFSTCLAQGQIGLGLRPIGQVSAAPIEGANAAARTAAQVARRMLMRMGLVEGVSFKTADITRLDTLNSAPVGYWTETDEVTALEAIGEVLGSIGAMIMPDRLGVFRMFRFDAPATYPKVTLTRAEILETEGRGFRLLATGDEGKGVPAWKVTVKYARTWAVASRNELETDTSDDYKAFAENEWRSAVAQDDDVKAIHKLAPELTYETYLVNEADAIAEAQRRLALHSVPRDRFLVPVKAYLVEKIDLGDIVRLQVNRFGLDEGKDFVVIGITENLETGITTLDVWG